MIFDKVVLHNFAIYQGRQEIILTPPSPQQPVILFGGLNGGGKTTFVDALQLVLYGKLARCSNRGSLAYDDFLRRCVNFSALPEEGAAIELFFHHVSEGVSHSYKVHRSWKCKQNSVKETVEVVKDGVFDRVLTETWPEQVDSFIPVQLSNLFFFDAEKIEGLADLENSAELLSTALHSLFGLELVERLASDLTVYERRKKVSLKSDSDQNRIELLKGEIEELGHMNEALFQARGGLQNELERLEKRKRELKAKFQAEGGDLISRRGEIESGRAETWKRWIAIEGELREIAGGIAPLLLVQDFLSEIARQGRFEAEAEHTSGFHDLMVERDQEILRLFRSRVPQPEPATELQSILLSLQSKDSETPVHAFLHLGRDGQAQVEGLLGESLRSIDHRIDALLRSAETEKGLLDEFDRTLALIPQSDALASIQSEIQNLDLQIESTKKKIGDNDQERHELQNRMEQKKARLSAELEKEVEDRLAVDDLNRTLNTTHRVRSTIENFRVRFLQNHLRRIEQIVLEGFRQLLRKEALVSDLRINPENFSLELFGSDGQPLPSERLSAGERQLLAVAMLWGFGRASGRLLPTVIDTPLGRLDATHRTHLVKRYFPFASHQVLLFSTDKEIDQEYFSELKPYVGRLYRLDFDEETKGTKVRNGYFTSVMSHAN